MSTAGRQRGVLAGLLVLGLAASAAAGAERRPLLVFAAASTTDALGEVIARWNEGGHVPATAAFAASSTLARQIEHGAPAAVFVSASPQWMDRLERAGRIAADTRADVASNALALVAPAASTVRVTLAPGVSLLEPLGDGRLAVADPDHVPAGIHARQALTHFGWWTQLEPRLARGGDVRAALAFVERRETPLGVVYVSDARASRAVRLVATFPADSHAPIRYPAAVVAAQDGAEARAFVRFLRSAPARAAFAAHGFGPP